MAIPLVPLNKRDTTRENAMVIRQSANDLRDASEKMESKPRNSPLKKVLGAFTRFLKTKEHPVKECEICFEEIPTTSFHEGRFCKRGTHQSSICTNCLTIHIRTQMKEEMWSRITCPFCPSRVRFRVVKTYVDPRFKHQYSNFLFSYKIRWLDNFQWCTSPDCHSGQLHDIRKLGNIMTCRECEFQTCAFHQMPSHHFTGQNCEEFGADVNPYGLSGEALERYQRRASHAMIKSNARRCPNCGVVIEKNGGCDVVHCSRCNAHFYWTLARRL